MDKELIKKRFSRKLKTYNENAKIQKQMAERLITLLKEESSFDDILEIGCGTGLLTKLASERLNFKNYIANDIVDGCENYVSEIHPEIKFIQGDIEKILFESDKKFDLIISNATIQWIEDFEGFIKKLLSKLNPHGILLFSVFGVENFREIYYVLGKTLKYYSKNEIAEMFKNYNTQIEEDIRIMMFKTPKEVLKHIQNTGVNALTSDVWTKKNLLEFEAGYNNFCSGRATLTYNPIYVKISSKT